MSRDGARRTSWLWVGRCCRGSAASGNISAAKAARGLCRRAPMTAEPCRHGQAHLQSGKVDLGAQLLQRDPELSPGGTVLPTRSTTGPRLPCCVTLCLLGAGESRGREVMALLSFLTPGPALTLGINHRALSCAHSVSAFPTGLMVAAVTQIPRHLIRTPRQ